MKHAKTQHAVFEWLREGPSAPYSEHMLCLLEAMGERESKAFKKHLLRDRLNASALGATNDTGREEDLPICAKNVPQLLRAHELRDTLPEDHNSGLDSHFRLRKHEGMDGVVGLYQVELSHIVRSNAKKLGFRILG